MTPVTVYASPEPEPEPPRLVVAALAGVACGMTGSAISMYASTAPAFAVALAVCAILALAVSAAHR